MKIVHITLYLVCSFSAFSQFEAEKFEATLLQAKNVSMLVYNGEKNSFSLKFHSKSVIPSDKPNFLTVDGILMQASITPFQQSLDFGNLSEDIQRKWLLSWKRYEKEWVEEQMKIKLKENEQFVKLADKLFLQWTYDMPKSNEQGAVVKQAYLITICFDQLLILNGPLEKGKSEEVLLAKFKSVGATLQLYNGQVQDLHKLSSELMK